MNDRKKRKTLKKKMKAGGPKRKAIGRGPAFLTSNKIEDGRKRLNPINKNPQNPQSKRTSTSTKNQVFRRNNKTRPPPEIQPTTNRNRIPLTYVKLKKLGSPGKYQIFFQDCNDEPVDDANNVFRLIETRQNPDIYSVESGKCVDKEFKQSN